MRLRTLVLRGLRHYRRTHLGVLAGTAVATATLVGALVVGDSVRYSLRRGAAERVGTVGQAMQAGDRFFRAAIADECPAAARVAPVVAVSGVASSADATRRAHDVQVLGVDARFFALGPTDERLAPPAAGSAYANAELARRLELAVGDEVVVRIEKPSALPRDMALAPGDVGVALRVRIDAIASAGSFGDFRLAAGSAPQANLIFALPFLQRELDVEGRANLLLADFADVATATAAFRSAWTLADAELEITSLAGGGRELRTRRIFFDDPILAQLEALGGVRLDGIFTYFVNEIRHGARATPYSMVTALGRLDRLERGAGIATQDSAAGLGGQLGAGEILLNEWVAEDLDASRGAEVELSYFVVDASRQLVEHSRAFRVAGVVPLAGTAADRELMPDFPGLADAENCRDWEPGTPVDLDRIRDKDEAYWDRYGGTPKAFLALETGRAIWSSRFGALTAVRFAAADEAAVRAVLRDELRPSEVGLFFQDVRSAALAAGDSATDFGGLFIGLSFFLIVAALLLSSQLLLFGVEQRAHELGLFAALGFPFRRVRALVLTEAWAVALAGAILGAALGLAYTRLVLWGLATLWRDAVSSVVLDFHAEARTVVVGLLASFVTAALTAWLATRRTLRVPAHRLLTSAAGVELAAPQRRAVTWRTSGWGIGLGLIGALALVTLVDPAAGPSAAGAFFGAGFLVLVAALAACRVLLHGARRRAAAPATSLGALGIRNGTRRPGRSLTTVALMAIGTFLVVAVGANRLGPTQAATERSSGTGGFALFGRTSLPVVHDLNSTLGRAAFGLDDDDLAGVAVVAMRARAGDDASCLNLARPQAPPLLGVASDELARRGAFRFAATIEPSEEPWRLLDGELDDGAIPAIGDVTSLTWQMHKSVGDTVAYVDERGRAFDVRIVAAVADSILQGELLISEPNFERLYPTQGGHQRFLIDAPPARVDEVAAVLSRRLRDVGLALERTSERLDAFHAVQNTYLLIFQSLGGLGLLLGSVGLGTVLLRNTLERRGELALAKALGFAPQRLRWWVVSEYGFLLALGLGAGAVSALVALVPAARAPGAELQLGSFALLVAGVAASGAFWVVLATRVAVRRAPISALYEE